jgi:hypothetical protein
MMVLDFESSLMTDKIEKFKCNLCQGDRNHYVRAEHAFRDEFPEDHGIWFNVRYLVVECCGCENLSFIKRVLCSENIGPCGYNLDGSYKYEEKWSEEIYPPINARSLPDWIIKLDDEILETVLLEVHRSLQSDSTFLAAFGCRTLMERFVFLHSGEVVNNLWESLKKLKEDKTITEGEFSQLELVKEAGDASAHRAWNPEKGDLGTILDIIESMLHRYIILKNEAEEIKAKIPPRPRRVS